MGRDGTGWDELACGLNQQPKKQSVNADPHPTRPINPIPNRLRSGSRSQILGSVTFVHKDSVQLVDLGSPCGIGTVAR